MITGLRSWVPAFAGTTATRDAGALRRARRAPPLVWATEGRSRLLARAGRIHRRGDGVVAPLEPHETHLLTGGLRHILEVLLVARRQKHRGDAGARRRQH